MEEKPGPTTSLAPTEDVDLDQIVERLGFSPQERLQYLLDMLDFEELARDARPRPRLLKEKQRRGRT